MAGLRLVSCHRFRPALVVPVASVRVTCNVAKGLRDGVAKGRIFFAGEVHDQPTRRRKGSGRKRREARRSLLETLERRDQPGGMLPIAPLALLSDSNVDATEVLQNRQLIAAERVQDGFLPIGLTAGAPSPDASQDWLRESGSTRQPTADERDAAVRHDRQEDRLTYEGQVGQGIDQAMGGFLAFPWAQASESLEAATEPIDVTLPRLAVGDSGGAGDGGGLPSGDPQAVDASGHWVAPPPGPSNAGGGSGEEGATGDEPAVISADNTTESIAAATGSAKMDGAGNAAPPSGANAQSPDQPPSGAPMGVPGLQRFADPIYVGRGVVQLPDRAGGGQVTLDASSRQLTDVRRSMPEDAAARARLPYGLLEFQLQDVPIGGIATVDVHLPEDSPATAYLKQDPFSGDLMPFPFDGRTGAVRTDFGFRLYLEDGGRGDLDGVANGIIVDPGGPTDGVVLMEAGAPNPLDSWTVREFGGGAQAGSVTFNQNEGAFVLQEGDSFLVELSRTIVIPENPAFIEMEYSGTFDPSDSDRINDAFEIAFLHDNGRSIVPTYRFGRDSHFNLTDGQSLAKGEGVVHTDHPFISDSGVSGILHVDISELPAGSTGTLLVRLVNNNETTGTAFRLHTREALVAQADRYSLLWNDVINVAAAQGVLANDFSPYLATPSVVLVNDTADGVLSLSSDGSFTYTPDPNFHGKDTFTYRITDGIAVSNEATVTISVTKPNTQPVAYDDEYTITKNTSLVLAVPGVLENDADADGDALEAVLLDLPTYGSLLLNTDGSLTYTPPANFTGTDTFTYQAWDGHELSNVATVTIGVNNTPPVVDSDTYTVTGDNTLVIDAQQGVLGNDTDANGDTLFVGFVSDPSHGDLTMQSDGSFSFTPPTGFVGHATFTYRASDGTDLSNLATVTINVQAPPLTAKFFVPNHTNNSQGKRTYVYAEDGTPFTQAYFNQRDENMHPRDVAAHPDGSYIYLIGRSGNNTKVQVYTTDGQFHGEWQPQAPPTSGGPGNGNSQGNNPLNDVRGIATDGQHVWILDASKRQIHFYENVANLSKQDLSSKPTIAAKSGATFALASDNRSPTGMDTREGLIWVTNTGSGAAKPAEVFVYDTSTHTHVGRWALPSANRDPVGITLDPTGSTTVNRTGHDEHGRNDMWVVDKHTKTVYRYPMAIHWRSNSQATTYDATWELHPDNRFPEGIADPPVVVTGRPEDGSSYAAGTSLLVVGQALPDPAPVTTVTIGGRPVDSIDAAGHYFATQTVISGSMDLTVRAADAADEWSTTSVAISGTTSPLHQGIDFSAVQRAVSTGLVPNYGRTSFHEHGSVLHVDLQLDNTGRFSIGAPILVGVTDITNPWVQVLAADGYTPDGIPYFDITDHVTAGVLPGGQSTRHMEGRYPRHG